MSNSTTSLPNISGGIPTSSDLAPSIVFILVYVPTLPVSLWRMYQCRLPLSLLFGSLRICLFSIVRLTTFVIRAIEASQAKNGQETPTANLFSLEQVFLGIGYIILVSQLVNLLRAHMGRTDIAPPTFHPESSEAVVHRRLNLLARVMTLALTVALALGVVAGTNYQASITNPATAATSKNERIISSIISLVVTALIILVSGYLIMASPRHPTNASAYLLLTSCFGVIIPAYRLSTIENSTNSTEVLTSTTTKIEFYVLQAANEWVALVLLLSVDVRKWFDAGGERAKEIMAERMELEPVPNSVSDPGYYEPHGRYPRHGKQRVVSVPGGARA